MKIMPMNLLWFLFLASVTDIFAVQDKHGTTQKSSKSAQELSPQDLQLQKDHPLFFAVQKQQYDEIVKLLEQGVSVYGKNNSYNPFWKAISLNDAKILDLLLQYGADVNKKDYYGYTPLLQAAYWNRDRVVPVLIKWNADLNIQEPSYGYTALQTAVYFGNHTIVQLLIRAGANVNIPDFRGNSPLHFAANRRYEKFGDIMLPIVFPLIFLINPERFNPEQSRIVKLLIDAGADVNALNKNHQTPLFNAVKCEFVNNIELLLQAHALVDVKDWWNKTVFDYVKNQHIIDLLRKYEHQNKKI